ncbi:MAG: GFA family protein [Patescibacteria group bacterium]
MNKTNLPITGGCACGKIRYESAAEAVAMLHCHCTDCQKWSGGPFSSYTVVPKETFKITQGDLKFYLTDSAGGGKNHRGFCADCGSPIISLPDSAPSVTAVMTGSLDDSSWFNQQFDVWTSDAQSWDTMNPELPKFEKYPTA